MKDLKGLNNADYLYRMNLKKNNSKQNKQATMRVGAIHCGRLLSGQVL